MVYLDVRKMLKLVHTLHVWMFNIFWVFVLIPVDNGLLLGTRRPSNVNLSTVDRPNHCVASVRNQSVVSHAAGELDPHRHTAGLTDAQTCVADNVRCVADHWGVFRTTEMK